MTGIQPRGFLAALISPLKPDQSLQYVATRDSGVSVAKGSEKPEGHSEKTIGLTGNIVTVTQTSEDII